jgi:hypothetical protein
MSMEQLMGFFQGDLVRNFGYTDDQTIESLFACQAELRRAGLDLPRPAADASELPTQPFGLFVPPSVEQVIGRRTIETETELIRGRDRRATMRRDSRMSISIPPDGGPAFVESLDLTSSAKLRRVASVDEEGDAGDRGNGDDATRTGKTASAGADQRRANYAKTRAVGNGPAPDRATRTRSNSGDAQPTANGGVTAAASARSPGAPVPVTARQKSSFNRKAVKSVGRDFPPDSDSAAPQQYGVTVRL